MIHSVITFIMIYRICKHIITNNMNEQIHEREKDQRRNNDQKKKKKKKSNYELETYIINSFSRQRIFSTCSRLKYDQKRQDNLLMSKLQIQFNSRSRQHFKLQQQR